MAQLPKEAIAFAKSMGLNLNGLEPEAQDIWRKLNELSESDPLQYHQFVSEQLKQGSDEAQINSSGSLNSDGTTRSFRPNSGFCIRTETEGGDGIKVRVKGKGKPLFINLCSSPVIEQACDKFGKPISKESIFHSADGLSVPLVVGLPRDFMLNPSNEACIAVDVVINPALLEICKSSGMHVFRRQIVDLALDWVRTETELQFSRSWSDDLAVYRGGRGDSGNVPVLFFVTEEMLEGRQNMKDKKQSALANTSSLLSVIQQQGEQEEHAAVHDLNIINNTIQQRDAGQVILPILGQTINQAAPTSKPSRSRLVQELSADGEVKPEHRSEDDGASEKVDCRGKESDRGLFGKVITCCTTVRTFVAKFILYSSIFSSSS